MMKETKLGRARKSLGCAMPARQAAGPFRARLALAAFLASTAAFGALSPLGFAPSPAFAQNQFSPRLYVNDQAITGYEVAQRALFLRVLNAPGDLEKEALKTLTDERLQLDLTKRLGLSVSDEDILKGMNEFAGRANLTAEQLMGELNKVGISAETFRDFVSAGLLWRQAVRQRFAGQINVTETEIDRALENTTRPKALKVLVSELVIPAEPGREDEALALANRLANSVVSEAEFAAAARQYSAAPTRETGGRLPDWIPLSQLPASIAGQIMALAPGQPSQPISVSNAVVLFMLRSVAEDQSAKPAAITVDWAEYYVADSAGIAQVKAETDGCNDLNALAIGQGPEILKMHSANTGGIPADVALELARLDAGEISATQTRSGGYRILMLCGRKAVMETEPSRDAIRDRLLNEKAEVFAENFMEELRAAAFIREP